MCIFEMLVVHAHRIIFVFPLIKEIHVMLVTSYNTHLPLMRGRRRKGGGAGRWVGGEGKGKGGDEHICGKLAVLCTNYSSEGCNIAVY